MVSKADDAEARVVTFMSAVDRDGQRRQMLDRARARQRADVDAAQLGQRRDERERTLARRIRIGADELVAIEREIDVAEQARGYRLERAREARRRRETEWTRP